MRCIEFFMGIIGYNADPKNILDSIVSGDETIVLYYDQLSKRESIEWRRPGEATPLKAKVTQSTKNCNPLIDIVEE